MLNEFDAKARDWDKNLAHIERSEAIAEALLQMVPLDRNMNALEFGAGTGLLSFLLKDHLSRITLIDNSAEMINTILSKISDQGIHHMHPLRIDLEHEDFPETFDLIFSQMALHHVEKLELVIRKLILMLNVGGTLAIADLYPEDGSFHGDGFHGHKGFDPDILSLLLERTGLEQVQHKRCHTIKKINREGKSAEYPVFLMKALKKA
ncbi:MAG: methyltransferase domain-containing protein [Bacteroidales bacterium]|nr:methyltransferase domain-containing protein [Bacteroidales bacterium]